MDFDMGPVLDSIADLGLALPGARGRPAGLLITGEPYSLTAEHVLQVINAPPSPGGTTQTVKQLRERHHKLAQLLASGMSEREASVQTGYSSSRISILKADPAFRELLSYYRDNQSALALEITEKMRQIGAEALEEIQHRMDEKMDEIDTGELRKIAEMALDRTGHGKSSTVKVEHGLGADILSELRRKHQAESERTTRTLGGEDQVQGKVIEHGPLDVARYEPHRAGLDGPAPFPAEAEDQVEGESALD